MLFKTQKVILILIHVLKLHILKCFLSSDVTRNYKIKWLKKNKLSLLFFTCIPYFVFKDISIYIWMVDCGIANILWRRFFSLFQRLLFIQMFCSFQIVYKLNKPINKYKRRVEECLVLFLPLWWYLFWYQMKK